MKEHLNTIVWVLSIATMVVAAAIAWFVWRFSKRDIEKKKSQQAGRQSSM